ncbi:ABC transporter substrate-binding protein [Chitinimonas sp.]|uniref:ABC transporter substrate-binding protein n=1 Tax=Chitinimonas sp. TaxID=1934313 RepID=UPI0035B0A8C5
MSRPAFAYPALACFALASLLARADLAAAERWLKQKFTPSTLSYAQQLEEMRWFIDAAKPYRGMTVRVSSEDITTHRYERDVMAKAFYQITGIKVIHDTRHEAVNVDAMVGQMFQGKERYDLFINDTDSIGAHFRYGLTVPLSDFMSEEGRDVTLPTLDLHDFIGRSFGTGPDGKLYQLPDQQFANLYWFRQDWFSRPDLKQRFRQKYGYALGVPINWSAYEDIAEFFSNEVKEIDGQRVYGHLDYAANEASLGWRFSDAWLSMAGAGDKGIPNGKPVDDWGLRVEGCNPAGASVARGGDLNGPAAVFALNKYLEWNRRFAPPEARQLAFGDMGSYLQKGNVAQAIFVYTAITEALHKSGLPINNKDGTPKWRFAPSPHGPYWEEGMKLGYQDAGAWTMLKATPLARRKAAWLYAQFTVAHSTSLKKTLVGLTPIRESDINAEAMSKIAPKLGGFVEFYRSPARIAWTPTGVNVPDYPRMAPLWVKHMMQANRGEKTPQAALDGLAEDMDQTMDSIAREGKMTVCPPRLNQRRDPGLWFKQPGAPRPKLANEKPPGETIEYDKLLQAWKEGRLR